jgi:hypothetical protein
VPRAKSRGHGKLRVALRTDTLFTSLPMTPCPHMAERTMS